MSEMLKEVAQLREEVKQTAKTGESDVQTEELSSKASEESEGEEASVDAKETSEEASEETAGEALAEPETLIRIGDREFRSQSEAIKYAEQLERDKLASDAHAAGIREALEATRQPTQQGPEPEDNFEERFYANPKETLREVQAKATRDALEQIRAENQREALWNQFLSENPDIRRKDAERILAENQETIGRMTDISAAMKVLARKTREEYEEIRDLAKPREELKSKKSLVPSPGGSASKGVTPKKEEKPLSFAEEVRRMRIQQ